MKNDSYPYNNASNKQFIFISKGHREIVKAVRFDRLAPNLFNVVFGDLRPDGSIDDKANSNNGDVRKVMATVVKAIESFMQNNPKAKVGFTGEHNRRILYKRILSVYHPAFCNDF